MPEILNNRNVFSLSEVTGSIRKILSERYSSAFWVKAEMNKLNLYKQSGHCYPELLQKEKGKIIAQFKAILWNDDYNHINNRFLTILKEPLKDGIKILFLARITFDAVHGLSLHILDIDPSFTLGDLEREKQETITRLRDDGLFYRNKQIKLPLLPQRIAIISVETSKGYADFLKVIEDNPWGYRFFHMLFPTILQGDRAIEGIIAQLQNVKKVKQHFDAVAIIRGGGGDVGLSYFNNYVLASAVSLFPLPVLTGIGHATNETVLEMISHTNAITPSKLAEFLIQKIHDFSVPVQDATEKIIQQTERLLSNERNRFQSETKLFRSVTENILIRNSNIISELSSVFAQQALFRFRNENASLTTFGNEVRKGIANLVLSKKQELNHFGLIVRKDLGGQLSRNRLVLQQQLKLLIIASAVRFRREDFLHIQLHAKLQSGLPSHFKNNMLELNAIERNIINLSPERVLERGYSITMLNGKAIKDVAQVCDGDLLVTVLNQGKIESIVKTTDN
jgi:exodeoxyribonuclease VII large subunit